MYSTVLDSKRYVLYFTLHQTVAETKSAWNPFTLVCLLMALHAVPSVYLLIFVSLKSCDLSRPTFPMARLCASSLSRLDWEVRNTPEVRETDESIRVKEAWDEFNDLLRRG